MSLASLTRAARSVEPPWSGCSFFISPRRAAPPADRAEADRPLQVEEAEHPQTRAEHRHPGLDGAAQDQEQANPDAGNAAETPNDFGEQRRRDAGETAQAPKEQEQEQET